MLKLFSTLFIIYAIILSIVFIFQRNFIYYPQFTKNKNYDALMPQLQLVKLKTSDDLTLDAWYKKAKDNMPTIVAFHGNAGLLTSKDAPLKKFLDEGYGLFIMLHRGYGPNPGKPTEQGLYLDARSAISFLRKQGVMTPCMVLYGASLGGAVAVQLASETQVGALILFAPFTSMVDVGKKHYPFLPVKWLLLDRYDNLTKIKKIHAPILMIHGENDRIVPVLLGRRLFEAANMPKELLFLENSGHDDIYFMQTSRSVIDFLNKHHVCQ